MLSHLLDNNRRWAQQVAARNPQFFRSLVAQQSPRYLWIGCSDSRVPANEIVGLAPGGPINEPQRIASWADFVALFSDPNNLEAGPFMDGSFLAHSVYERVVRGRGPRLARLPWFSAPRLRSRSGRDLSCSL